MKPTVWVIGVLAAALVLGTGAAVWAERPENPGPPSDPGGSPEGEMLDVRGCAYFDDVLGVWRLRAPAGFPNCLDPDPALIPYSPEWYDAGCNDTPDSDACLGTDYKIDFGPEPYCPDPCLTGDLITDQLDGTNPVTIKIGKNLVGTFKWSADPIYNPDAMILAATDADGPARKDFGLDWIPLTPAAGTDYGRPVDEGKWVRVYGRAGETPYAVLVWELRYPNTFFDTDYSAYNKWFWWRTSGQPWAMMWLLDCYLPDGEE